MALAQLVDVTGDRNQKTSLCLNIACRWAVAVELAARIVAMAVLLPFRVQIISGYRTAAEQARQYAGAAPDHLSTHRSNPATGADLRPLVDQVNDDTKRAIGRAAEAVGLRWGGGAQRVNGIPVGNEWAHVDLGPRRS